MGFDGTLNRPLALGLQTRFQKVQVKVRLTRGGYQPCSSLMGHTLCEAPSLKKESKEAELEWLVQGPTACRSDL